MADNASSAAAAASPPSQPAGTVAVKPLPASASTSTSKKNSAVSKAGAKKARAKPAHPPTSEMVNNAVKSLKERGGSSLQAIKKYILATYKADAERLSPFIKKYLKAAVTAGTLVQTKGKGASGSFKLSSLTLKEKATPAASTTTKGKKTKTPRKGAKKVGKPAGKKTPASTTSTVAATKRSAPKERSKAAPPAKKAKKPVAEKPKKKAVSKPVAKTAKSPSKAKKATKPRAPKLKKTPTKAKPAAKKPAAQKKK